jgi:hypothetical protein
MKLHEVDAQRDRDDVGRVDPVELLAREGRSAHHRVVVRGRPAVGEVGDGAGSATRQDLSGETIQPLVGDHHGGDVVPAAPRAQ